MSFVLLHYENSLCGHEACIINITQIAAVLPISASGMPGKIYAERSNATIRLTDGKTLRVKETLETVMGLLRTSVGKNVPLVGAGPQPVDFEGARHAHFMKPGESGHK